jgi:hypothetical protein
MSTDGKGDKHKKDRRNSNTFISAATLKCLKWKSAHVLHRCDKLCNLRIQGRRAVTERYNLCLNCMQEGHRAREFSTIFVNNVRNTTTLSYIRIARNKVHLQFHLSLPQSSLQSQGYSTTLQNSTLWRLKSIYINEELAQRLQLKRRCNEMPITGINNTCSAATHTMAIMFSCKDNKYSNVVTWFILPNMTGNMSSRVKDITTWKLP